MSARSCCSSLIVALATLAVLVAGAGRLAQAFLDRPAHQPALGAAGDRRGRPAILAALYLVHLVFAVLGSDRRRARRSTWRSTRTKDRWYNRLLELNIQNLAGVPSIVYGILGLAFLVRGLGLGRTLLAGSLILTLLVLPTVIIASREAIRSVPPSIRDGAYALGATPWQVTWRQVLPAAIPGIATGSILALSRAIGETAPLLLVGALMYVRFNPDSDSGFTALPVQIYNWVEAPAEDFQYLAAAGIVVLLAMLLTLNSVAILLRNRYQKRW